MEMSPPPRADLKQTPSPKRGCYLGGGSKLGKRCHWFLSAATSRTDTTEAAAMSRSPAALPPLVGAHRLRPALCKSSAPPRKPLVLRRPPSRSELCGGRSLVWWASPPEPIKTQNKSFGAAIG